MNSKEYNQRYYRKHAKRIKANNKAYRRNNPDKMKAIRKRWYKAHKHLIKRNNLRLRYNLSLDQYNALYEQQNGLCAICSASKKILCVDHCHKSGIIRSLLCRSCNRGLGLFNESPAVLKQAIKYIKRFDKV